MTAPPRIFDRELLRLRRQRAAAVWRDHDFLARTAADEIQERLETLIPAPVADAVCCGHVRLPDGARLATHIAHGDLTPRGDQILLDEEQLTLPPQSVDVYASVLTLHTVNDLPGALIQIRRALRPKGRFMAALFGPKTLQELRTALSNAELECEGGVSPRIHPFVDVKDAGALLQRAGFEEPVADTFDVPVIYKTPMRLLQDLRGMGETNILTERRKGPLRRATLNRAMEIYAERFSAEGGVGATFELLFMSGRARG
jgi:NADH dehydrogenase [ubiquinone] 1 alpha subcomplex assembly factor 5